MKKVLFLLLVTSISYGQALFDKGIKVTTNINDTIATKVVVKSANNVYNYQDIVKFQKEKGFLSTGLIKNGLISANGDPTKFNITAGVGIISNFDNPENPISTIIRFSAFNSITPTYLTTGNITYVAINSTPAVVMQATPFTPEQRRSLIILGAVIHSNLTTINVLNNISAPTNADTNQLHDFMEAVGALNITGNKYTANGANLQLNKSAGVLFKLGSNFAVDWKNPHEIAQTGGTAITFRYRTQNGTESADMTSISPGLYDLNNVLTTVPNNKFTIQTVTVFQTGLTRIQWGQTLYDDLQSAKNALLTRNFVVENNIKENGVTRAYIIVRNSTTSLQNIADAYISEAQKFGGVASGGVALTLANIVTALGYTPENAANKQNSLAVDGTGIKYPTVDATNAGLALKANIDNPTFTGVLTNTNNIISNNTDGVPSRFGATPTNFLPVNLLDILSSVNTNFSSGDGHYRAISAIGEFSGTSSSSGTITGISGRGTTASTSTGDLTLTTFGGGFKGGRFRAAHRGSGTITKASGVSADIQNTGGVILNSVAFNAEPAYVALDKTTTSHYAFLAEGGSVLGTLTNNHGLYINPLIGGVNRWGIYQAGSTDKNYFAGNTLFGTTTDNSQGVAQFNGNITVSDGTLANHAVNKGQLDLKQNTLTNPITGSGTTNTFPIFTGTTTLGNSILTQTSLSVKASAPFSSSTVAPLIVNNETPYSSPFNQHIQFWQSNNVSIAQLRADGLFTLVPTDSNMSSGFFTARSSGTATGVSMRLGTNNTGFFLPLANTVSLSLAGTERVRFHSNGNTSFNTSTDNGQGVAQFNGNITISNGTLPNHGVTKSQLDLKADITSQSLQTIMNNNLGSATSSNIFQVYNPTSLGLISVNDTEANGVVVGRNDSYFKTNDTEMALFSGGVGVPTTKLTISRTTKEFLLQKNFGTKNLVVAMTQTLSGFADNTRVTIPAMINSGNYRTITERSTSDGGALTYTVATLPTGALGDNAIVSDATAPTYLGTLTGGGSVTAPVWHNGTTWVSR